MCDLEHYRIIQSIVAELKILAITRYPKEILRRWFKSKIDNIQFQKAKIRLNSRPYYKNCLN